MSGSIAENSARLRDLQRRVHETNRQQPHGPAHHAACAQFHDQYDALAFPGGLANGLNQLSGDDPPTVETAVRFLEADQRFFRSGYIKEKILRRLKHCTLTDEQCRRLRRLVVRSIEGGGRREFRGYSRLAGPLICEELVEEVQARTRSHNAEVARRAADVLHVWQSQRAWSQFTK